MSTICKPGVYVQSSPLFPKEFMDEVYSSVGEMFDGSWFHGNITQEEIDKFTYRFFIPWKFGKVLRETYSKKPITLGTCIGNDAFENYMNTTKPLTIAKRIAHQITGGEIYYYRDGCASLFWNNSPILYYFYGKAMIFPYKPYHTYGHRISTAVTKAIHHIIADDNSIPFNSLYMYRNKGNLVVDILKNGMRNSYSALSYGGVGPEPITSRDFFAMDIRCNLVTPPVELAYKDKQLIITTW